jgi:hypothetical protein
MTMRDCSGGAGTREAVVVGVNCVTLVTSSLSVRGQLLGEAVSVITP